jgi:hypothetical protein
MSRGNGDDMSEAQERQLHGGQLQGPAGDSNAPAVLEYTAEPEEIDAPIDELAWFNSKSTSTTNLEEEDIQSKEWVLEYHKEFAAMQRPPNYGIHGHFRAFVYDDTDEWARPIVPTERLEVEGYGEMGKEQSARSKEGWLTETATRDTKESIVRDEKDSGGGGLLGRIRG